LGTGFLFGVPVPVYLMAAVLVIATVFMRSTNVGQEIYAIGANPEAARLSGIPVRRRQMLVYMLSGLMSGIAAVVFLARVNAADSGMGEPLLLPVIAAVLIGGTSLFGGVGSVLGTVFGAIILALVINGMNLLDIRAQWQPLVVGVVLLAAVMVDLVGRGRRERIG
jgi:ribose transport system permease protein